MTDKLVEDATANLRTILDTAASVGIEESTDNLQKTPVEEKEAGQEV